MKKKITTTEKYSADGTLIERIVVTEEESNTFWYQPYVITTTPAIPAGTTITYNGQSSSSC